MLIVVLYDFVFGDHVMNEFVIYIVKLEEFLRWGEERVMLLSLVGWSL